jgi:DNA-binding transcriptional ArsR family regulator
MPGRKNWLQLQCQFSGNLFSGDDAGAYNFLIFSEDQWGPAIFLVVFPALSYLKAIMPKLYIEPGFLSLFEMARQVSRPRVLCKDIDHLSIPEEIADSLCSCGGIEGLIEQIPPDEVFEQMQPWYQACADPVRLKILSLLLVQPLCVCVIKSVVKMADSKLSYHLNILKKAGIIEGKQQGQWIIYNVTDEARMFLEQERERFLAR